MGILLLRSNEALSINPPPATNQSLTTNGSDWLWAVTAVFTLSWLLLVAHSFVAKQGERVFHYLFSITLFVGTIAYFAMASDLAWVVESQWDNPSRGDPRQIFWARYVYWVVSFPTVTTVLGLVSGASWATMIYWVALAWIWVINYLVGAFTATSYKWGFFVFGTVAWMLLASSITTLGHTGAARLGTSGSFTVMNGFMELLWLLYPIAWGLSDGGNRIGVTPGFIFFGILDVLMIPALSVMFLVMSNSWDYAKMNLYFTQYGRVRQGGDYPEKGPGAPATGEAPAAAV